MSENAETEATGSPIKLRRPGDFGPGERPTVSLHLLVKNGESCLPRLLANLGPYVDEVVAVLNDTTDGTERVLLDFCRAQREDREEKGLPGFRWKFIDVTSGTHPELYIIDEAETYSRGAPLAGESAEDVLGSFTGKPLLARWADLRNLGWRECTGDFVLFLDADDVLLDPEALPGVCALMDERGADLAVSRYRYSVGEDGRAFSESYRERLARNRPEICWDGVAHEVLRGYSRRAYLDGNLVAVDHKDSTGEGVRVPGRCLKVLYHSARSRGWDVDARTLLYLGQEAKVAAPEFAVAVLERYLDVATWPEERAWACSMVGEVHEAAGRCGEASGWYERALCEHPGSKAAYRLCRSRFAEKRWADVVSAYEVGVANESVMQVLDHGPAFRDMSKILVAAALDHLADGEGDPRARARGKVEAWLAASDALRAFPENSALGLLREHVRETMDVEHAVAAVADVIASRPGDELARDLLSQLAGVDLGGGEVVP